MDYRDPLISSSSSGRASTTTCAIVLRDAKSQNTAIGFKEYETAGQLLNVSVQSLEIGGLNPDIEGIIQSVVKGRANALLTITEANLFRYQKRIAESAIENRLPSMFEGQTWVEQGGLVSYSADDLAAFRRAAFYVDKILKVVSLPSYRLSSRQSLSW